MKIKNTRKNAERLESKNKDWPAPRIKYELEMRGHSLASVSRAHGYHHSACAKALRQSWPEAERLIAEAVGVEPQAIWPSRYTSEGYPTKYLPRTWSIRE